MFKFTKDIFIIIVTIGTLWSAFKSEHAIIASYKLFTNKLWLINFGILIAFSIYMYIETNNIKNKIKNNIKNNIKNKNDNKIKEWNNMVRTSLKKAIFGFLIAIFAELKLTIAPFWLIFSAAYYLDDWI